MKIFYTTLSVMSYSDKVYRNGVFAIPASSIQEILGIVNGLHIGYSVLHAKAGLGEASVNLVAISEKKPRGMVLEFSRKNFGAFMS